jgi:hypothetical protein
MLDTFIDFLANVASFQILICSTSASPIVPSVAEIHSIALPSLGTGSEENKANLNSVVRAIRHAIASPVSRAGCNQLQWRLVIRYMKRLRRTMAATEFQTVIPVSDAVTTSAVHVVVFLNPTRP